MPTITMKKVLVLSSDARACQAATAALAEDFSIYASPCEKAEVTRFVLKMRPDVLICDLELLRSASAASRLSMTTGTASEKRAKDEIFADESTIDLAAPCPAPRLLTLLAEGDQKRILECFESGADDYVLTPILRDELRSKVENLVSEAGPASSKTANRSSTDLGEPEDEVTSGAPESDMPSACPTTLGRYELAEIIGQGGYGVVYRAIDRQDGKVVALKLLPAEAGEQPEAVARFFRESSAIARLNHPNIVRFYEFDSFSGRFFFSMELAEGIDLKELADQDAPLNVYRAANFIIQAARGLQALNSIGFVHRDVKPENMILCEDGTVKLIDFGLVKILDAATITCENDVLGTPYYMGPEYISGETNLDVRYDIYSLGVTFYVFLTGQYPFVGKNTAHVLEKHLRARPPSIRKVNPSAPEAIDSLIQRMLAKKPSRRPASPQEIIDELTAILGPSVLQPS